MLDFRSNLSKLKKTRKISTLPELFGFSILKKKKKKKQKKEYDHSDSLQSKRESLL